MVNMSELIKELFFVCCIHCTNDLATQEQTAARREQQGDPKRPMGTLVALCLGSCRSGPAPWVSAVAGFGAPLGAAAPGSPIEAIEGPRRDTSGMKFTKMAWNPKGASSANVCLDRHARDINETKFMFSHHFVTVFPTIIHNPLPQLMNDPN